MINSTKVSSLIQWSKPIFLFVFCLFGYNSIAQQSLIKGVIQDESELPLINVTVYVQGKIEKGYVNTSYDGRFEITASRGDTLVVSGIGYALQKVAINERILKIILSIDEQEVQVRTGLGISRSEQELGFAIQTIGGEEMITNRTTNFLHSLSGRSPGVQIRGSSNGPTASVSALIRGEASLSGDNQPLIVLNGVPITNDLFSSGDGSNGSSTIDFGNAAQIIDASDIQSISVLRGASAAIAYGSRAHNGVILITSKAADAANSWQVTLNSNLTFQTVLKMPDFQNEYGFGGEGKYSYQGGYTYTGNLYDAYDGNWGPKLDGSLIKQWNSNGVATPYVAQSNNIQDFYRVGFTSSNNFALSKGGENGNFRLSYNSIRSSDIVPNSNLDRDNFQLNLNEKLADGKFRLTTNFAYNTSRSKNVPSAGYDENSSIAYGWLFFPRNADINDLKDYWQKGKKDIQQEHVEELWTNNPWFVVNENTNSFDNGRFLASGVVEYDFLPQLTARLRMGLDNLVETRFFKRAFSSQGTSEGSYRKDVIDFLEVNIEASLSYRYKKKNKPFSFSNNLFINVMRQSGETSTSIANGLSTPGIYNLGNVNGETDDTQYQFKKGINSLFTVNTFSYKKILHAELAGRVDNYSTLPFDRSLVTNNVYPSITLSFVVSELLNLRTSSPLNFLKVRSAYGQVRADGGVYKQQDVYDYDGTWGGYNLLTQNGSLKNSNLVPEQTSSLEYGLDARLFQNRLNISGTYYNTTSRNLILELPTSASSGYTSQIINSGSVNNSGIELLLTADIIKKQNINWQVSLNFTHNKNTVTAITDGITSTQLVSSMFPNDVGDGLALEAKVGEPFGLLTGFGFQRDEQGNIKHKDGLPMITEERVSAGSYEPDAFFGLSNTINYGQWSLSFLFDGQLGGQIYSRTHALMNTAGTITNYDDPNLDLSTLDGREEYDITYDATGSPVYTLRTAGGVVGNGVMQDANGNWVPNTEKASTQDYFSAYYGNGSSRDNIEAATFDATYVKLRELSISYRLPKKWLKKSKIRAITISLIGRNLLLFSAVPSIDPETYSIRNNQIIHGFESTQLPSTRSFGLNFNINF